MCGQVSALTVLTSDTVISDGETYDSIGVTSNATIIMTGGTVTSNLTLYDTCKINMSGGSIGLLGQGYQSSCNIEISGTSNINNFYISNSTNATVSNGTFNNLDVSTSGNVDLSGGSITDYLIVYTKINIHGYGFNYNSESGAYDGGQLTGFWLDDTPFVIDLKNYGGGDEPIYSTYDNLNLVPEPATLVMLSLGGLFFRRCKC
jgi:hypothetical protein